MSEHDDTAQKLIPCTCGGYGQNNRRHLSDCPRHGIAWEDIATTLTAAVAAEREKWKAFAGPDGEPRKVLGTLPVTADGAIAMPGSFVYAKWWGEHAVRGFVRHEVHAQETCCFVEMTTTTDYGRCVGIRSFLSDCYSTRAAAESALAAQTKEPRNG
jgi:hypothetical protein